MQYPSLAHFEFPFPDRDQQYVNPPTPGWEYACYAITQGSVHENHLGSPNSNGKGFSGPVARAFAGAGDEADKFAIKIASDEKGVFILSAGAVESGSTDAGEPIPITFKSSIYVVANDTNRGAGASVTALVLNVKTLKAVYSYTGEVPMGIEGWSILLACD